jgi:hypothetical protein
MSESIRPKTEHGCGPYRSPDYVGLKQTNRLGRAVLITTIHHGVFFGYLREKADHKEKKEIKLYDARCAIQWNTEGGFLELAGKGPNKGSHIGDRAPCVTFYDLTSVSIVHPNAVTAWESAPVGKPDDEED